MSPGLLLWKIFTPCCCVSVRTHYAGELKLTSPAVASNLHLNSESFKGIVLCRTFRAF
jgi:hypothetical protein